MTAKEKATALLEKAGVTINGSKPYDLQVHDERLFTRIFKEGTMGVGESYMDGWWDVEDLDEFFTRVFRLDLARELHINPVTLFYFGRAFLVNTAKKYAFAVGEDHYDIGNDVYKAMLDKRLTYTCGYWKDAKNLDDAQEAKLDLICRKIGLKKGDSVLDIGSGWGSFINFAGEKYGAKGYGVTVSKEQVAYANEHAQGLDVETKLLDYHDVEGTFDHLVSVGMFEHVGVKNYRAFFKKAHSVLKDDGLFLLHTIGSSISKIMTDPWIQKYIFPNSMLPSIKQVGKSVEGLFVIEDLHNFGAYYDITLMEWWKNFDASWNNLKEKYDERFYRMWKFYLMASAGMFRSRRIHLWQFVLSKNGVPGGYVSIR